MLLHDARREARVVDGELVRLEDQDRGRWDAAQVTEGRLTLDRAIALRGPGATGAYVLQAAIAALHADEPRDWPQIAALYRTLLDRTGSPVVALNHAIAIAMAGDPATALTLVDGLSLDGFPYLHSTRGELLRRLDRPAEARTAFERALALTTSEVERRFLRRQLDGGA